MTSTAATDTGPEAEPEAEPVATISFESVDFATETLCAQVFSASFASGQGDHPWARWEEGHTIVVFGDDYIDSAEAECIDDTIRALRIRTTTIQ